MKLTNTKSIALVGAAVMAMGGATAAAATTAAKPSHNSTSFSLVRSGASLTAGCLVNAGAQVKITNRGPVEVMTIDAHGLPKNTDFDVFITQLPNAPFGVSWYQGDLESNRWGAAHGSFVGRFSVETFAVAPGTGPAPVVHRTPIKDADSNPAFAPVHEYHVGVWFNSPDEAGAAGCAANVVTPFNGEHNAGPQALSTRRFPDTSGPLSQLQP
jgi:hypothetical protein